MSKFLDTTGRSTLGIGLCARCSRKFSLDDLQPDPNYPNLMVCRDDTDNYDPYRLAPRGPDKIVLPFVRPDESVEDVGPGGITPEGATIVFTTEDGRLILP